MSQMPMEPTPSRAIQEACSIARNAADDAIEIDWTKNPASDRERDLRR